MTVIFDINGDFKTAFKSAVTRIVRQPIEDMAEKNAIVQQVTENYITQTGERPEVQELDELSSWLIFGRKGVSLRKKMEIKTQEELDKRAEEALLNG